MKRWLPRTLFGQMVLILLAGLLVSHLVGTLIFASDRARAVRAIGGYAATQRIANLARLVDEAPAPWRARIVAAASDPTLLVTLSPQPPAFAAAATDADSQPIERYLAEQLPAPLAEHLHVAVSAAVMPPPGLPAGPPGAGYGPHMAMGGRVTGDGPMGGMPMGGMPMGGMTMGGVPIGGPPWMAGLGGRRGLQAAVQLSDGAWLTFVAALPGGGPAAPWPFVAAMAVMAVVVVLASVWAVGRVTAPLGMLARAAERLGRDVTRRRSLRPERAKCARRRSRSTRCSSGSSGCWTIAPACWPPCRTICARRSPCCGCARRACGRRRSASEQRIRRLLGQPHPHAGRLSHDLRTPLTLLRLRTEGMRRRRSASACWQRSASWTPWSVPR